MRLKLRVKMSWFARFHALFIIIISIYLSLKWICAKKSWIFRLCNICFNWKVIMSKWPKIQNSQFDDEKLQNLWHLLDQKLLHKAYLVFWDEFCDHNSNLLLKSKSWVWNKWRWSLWELLYRFERLILRNYFAM